MAGTNMGADQRSTAGAAPREPAEAAARAAGGVAEVEIATDALLERLEDLTEIAASAPSRLPDWSRAHLISHLARNADALVNLLTWARTGVEHALYASRADRDADIEEGAHRPARLLVEDLRAASERFTAAARGMSDTAWQAEVAALGEPISAHEVPWMRLRELWVHLVDLDLGVEMTDIPAKLLEQMLDDTIRQLSGRPEAPSMDVAVELPGGRQRVWQLNAGASTQSTVRGRAVDVLAWLTGRGDSSLLGGTVPELQEWL